MKRVALPLVAIALGAVALTAMRMSPVSAAAPLPARHIGIASGTLARAVEAVVSPIVAPHEDLRASTRRRVKANQKGTYISDILAERDSSLARWPDRAGSPLTVWIQPQSNVSDFTPDYVSRVRSAFEDWDALHLPVHFSFVDDSAHAEVHVTWIDHFAQPISGRTRWSRDDDWQITNANIVLAVHHSKGEQLDSESMHAMALHEIGHLLGLDHTTDSLSIMAPRVRVRALSEADRATVRLVYALPAGPVR
jgi:predicted Zn-dependent protease